MKKTLTLDMAGRIVLPQPVRERFHLHRGSTLELDVEPDAIVLRPSIRKASVVEEDGLLVHEGEPTGDLLTAVEAARARRDRDVGGALP